MKDISTLIWKEYRNNVHLLIFAASAMALPLIWANSIVFLNAQPEAPLSEMLAVGLLGGSIGAIVFSQFVMLCLGGHLISGERSTRTFEFLFLQPVSRHAIAISKLLFAFIWSIATWLIVGMIALVGYLLIPVDQRQPTGFFNPIFFVEVAVVGFMLFAMSWLASSRLNNSVVSMCAGALASSFVFIFLLMVIGDRFEEAFTMSEYNWTRILVMFPVSVIAVVVGFFLFLKRKSP